MNKSTKPTKRCPKCKEESPSKFGKNKATPDGLQVYCKTCRREMDREYRNRNKAKNTAKEQQQTGLIPIEAKTVSSQQIQTVNARDLHSFLESKREFATWIKNRIAHYSFEEGVDFIKFDNFVKSNSKARIDYLLTLDMAKELSMVERTEKGRQARKYFIECERIARGMNAHPIPATLTPALLTENQQKQIHEAVKSKVESLFYGGALMKVGYMTVWSEIKKAFGVDTYKDIHSSKKEKVLKLIRELKLIKAQYLPPPMEAFAGCLSMPEEQMRDEIKNMTNRVSAGNLDFIYGCLLRMVQSRRFFVSYSPEAATGPRYGFLNGSTYH